MAHINTNTPIDLSPEYKLLISCSKIEIDDTTKNKLQGILCNSLNWPYILQESIKEGITCLLYNNLLQFKHHVPKNIWDRFKNIYYANMSRNIKIYKNIKAILSSFNKENRKVIPLKGAFLAEKIYNNIALRPISADIDLLIKKEDLPNAAKILNDLGYRTPINKHLTQRAVEKSYINSIDYVKTEKSPPLHIHWHIVNVTLPTYMYAKNIKMERFFEYAKPAELADTETLGLVPHHLIMYLCEHALKHSFDRLILLSDIDAVIKKYEGQINWQALIKETKDFGMERQLFYGLYFTKYFLETDMPDFILSSLRPKRMGFLEKRFFNSISDDKRGSKLCYFVYLNMSKGIANKLRFIFRTLFPPPSVLVLTFNLGKPKVTIKDYFLFLQKQLLHFKKLLKRQ